jgi:N-glycosylase/DNA lyase
MNAATCGEPRQATLRRVIPARDYDLDATLASGQVFRWRHHAGAWEGVVGGRWVRLRAAAGAIAAEVAEPVADWRWLEHFLQTDVALEPVLARFPQDPPLRAAVAACRGLRLLRQEPWECLASFILSATKQIVQIQQVVALLCERHGPPVPVPPGHPPAWAFPRPEAVAALTEAELRGCKMGFRAPKLLATARRVAVGDIDLPGLAGQSLAAARAALLELPGVGPKIAECVLLFAYGFQEAFPVDVWVEKALRRLYFPGRRPTPRRLREFARTHFGPAGGYAQQYLFHYMRTRSSQGSGSQVQRPEFRMRRPGVEGVL